MARPKIKSTYVLDEETLSRLEELARRWGVSKTEALRRAVRAVAGKASWAGRDAVSALDKLQRVLRLSRAKAHAWVRRSAAERSAAAARRERARA